MSVVQPVTRGLFFWTALVRRRTWSEFLYALLGLPIGIVGFVFIVVEMSVSATLLVTVVGLPLIAVAGFVSRWLGSGLRSFANMMIGTDVPPAQPFRGKPGMLGWIGSCLTDGTAWRARLYLALKLPVGIASVTTAASLYAAGIVGLTYWAWRPFLSCDSRTDAVCHKAPEFGNHQLDTTSGIFLVFLAGAVLLLLTPQVVRGVLAVDKLMVRTLLGPRSGSRT
jgi:hypothetical protein